MESGRSTHFTRGFVSHMTRLPLETARCLAIQEELESILFPLFEENIEEYVQEEEYPGNVSSERTRFPLGPANKLLDRSPVYPPVRGYDVAMSFEPRLHLVPEPASSSASKGEASVQPLDSSFDDDSDDVMEANDETVVSRRLLTELGRLYQSPDFAASLPDVKGDAEPVETGTVFPVLGRPAIQDPENEWHDLYHPSRSLEQQSPGMGYVSEVHSSRSLARSLSASPLSSEDELDLETSRLILVSSYILLRAYSARTSDSTYFESEQYDSDGSKSKKQATERQQPQNKSGSRKRGVEKSGGNNGNEKFDKGLKKRRREINGTISDEDRPLACPFNNHDDRLFGADSPDQDYHGCGTCSFIHIAHLK